MIIPLRGVTLQSNVLVHGKTLNRRLGKDSGVLAATPLGLCLRLKSGSGYLPEALIPWTSVVAVEAEDGEPFTAHFKRGEVLSALSAVKTKPEPSEPVPVVVAAPVEAPPLPPEPVRRAPGRPRKAI